MAYQRSQASYVFWPAGPGDSRYVVIRFVPSRIELMNIERQLEVQDAAGV